MGFTPPPISNFQSPIPTQLIPCPPHHPRARTRTRTQPAPLSIQRPPSQTYRTMLPETMDSEGKRYVQDMRRAGSDNSSSNGPTAPPKPHVPLTGYLGGRRMHRQRQPVPLQASQTTHHHANVAVHPTIAAGHSPCLTNAPSGMPAKKINNIWLRPLRQSPGHPPLHPTPIHRTRAAPPGRPPLTFIQNWIQTSPSQADIQPSGTQLNWLLHLSPALAWHRD